jgi:MFS family permease
VSATAEQAVAGPAPGMRAVLSSVASLLLGVGFLSAAAGALLTVLGLRLTEMASTALVGVVMSAYFVGLLLGSLSCALLIDRVGHIRAHAVFAAVAALATLLHVYSDSLVLWTALRVVTGYCMAGLFMTAESWLNDKATNATRGRVMSIYLITSSGAFGLGPLAVNLGDPGGPELFVLVAVLFNVALLPVAVTRTGNPRLEERSRFGLRRLLAASPLGVVGCAAEGLINGAIYGMGAVYAKALGLEDSEVSLFFSSMLFGALILLFPIGTLSDRFDRRKVLLALALAAAAVAVLIGVFGARDVRLLLALAFLIGGLTSPIYGLSVAQTNDYLKREEFVAAAGGLLLAYSIGASVGPAAAAGAMSAIGPFGLWGYVVIVCALLVGFTVYRMLMRAARPVREQSLFVAVSETTPAAVKLDPRAEGEDLPESLDPDLPSTT